jgi:hypothetical protein
MLPKLLLFIPVIPIAMGGPDSDGVTATALFTWLGCAAFVIFMLNQSSVFWRNFIKQDPASSEVANNLSHFEKTLSTGLSDLKDSLSGKMEELETEMDDRFRAAATSRKGMHKTDEELRTAVTRCQVEVENLKQQKAIQEMAGKS